MREQGAERLLYLMAQLPDELLDEAVSYQKPAVRTVSWNKGALVAACLCICLTGGLMWSTLRESVGETGATTLGGISVGTAGGQGEKPTLSPSVEQTGARPVDSTDEIPVDSTNETSENATSGVGMMVSEFLYRGQLYVDAGILLEALPDGCVLQGVLPGSGLTTETDWITKDPSLAGARVYRMEEDQAGLYVETVGGYRYYGKGSGGE